MNDEHENTAARPEGEIRPRPEGGNTETRSMADLVAQYGDGAASAAGAATVYYGIKGAAKLKDVLTSKDEPSKIALPPGTEE